MKIRSVLAAFAGASMLALTGVAVASAQAPAGAAPAPAPAPAAKAVAQTIQTAPTCQWWQLSAGLHGSQAHGSYRGFLVTFTNTSDQSCTLNGYVTLKLLSQWYRPLYTQTVNGNTLFDRDQGAAPVVLSPGETASADIGYYTSYRWPWQGKPVMQYPWDTAMYLQVTAPGTSHPFTMRIPGGPVSVASGRMFATAMARHTEYPGYPVVPIWW